MSNQHNAHTTIEEMAQIAMIGFARLNALAAAIDAAREDPYMVMELARVAEDLARDRRDAIEGIREESLRILSVGQGGAK